MLAVRYRNGDAVSTVDFTTHIEPVIPSGSRRAVETMPDEYFAIADDGARGEGPAVDGPDLVGDGLTGHAVRGTPGTSPVGVKRPVHRPC
jgi:hypothetical protein